MNIKAFNEDCADLIGSQTFKDLTQGKKVCIVTDPPFNVGYHYNSYKDNMKEEEYFEWLGEILTSHGFPFVVIHYPEALYKLAFQVGLFPERVVSWVYNSNTPRQHRDIAFFKIQPDFTKVRQPYKNIGDKRCERLMSEGTGGARIYDWWNVNQVKNVSKDKTFDHPCKMPLKVMENIVGTLPEDYVIFDPFMGSGTTGIACRRLGRNFIGCELDERYYRLACEALDRTQYIQEELF